MRKRTNRLNEIHLDNLDQISASYEFQIRTLRNEHDDINLALKNVQDDTDDAMEDLCKRINEFGTDL
jgi:hypothetical protein